MKNGWLRKIPAVLAAAFLFFLSAQTVQAAGNTDKTPEIMPYGAAMEATSIARVRLGPSVDFPVAGALEPGQAVNVCGRTADGWYEVVFGNGIGYVNGKLLMPIPVDEAMLAALAEQAEWVSGPGGGSGPGSSSSAGSSGPGAGGDSDASRRQRDLRR